MFTSNDKERQRANVGDLYTELTACDSFKDFFIVVCKEKIVRDREGLNELINLVNDGLTDKSQNSETRSSSCTINN